MAGGSSEQIILHYMNYSAPTGEGQRYVTQSGQHWRDVMPFEKESGTGQEKAIRRGDRIHQK